MQKSPTRTLLKDPRTSPKNSSIFDVLINYKDFRVIGMGPQSIVYKAICIQNHKNVAVKAIRKPLIAKFEEETTDQESAFEKQKKFLSSLKHYSVLPVLEYHYSRGKQQTYCVLPFYVSLRALITQKKTDETLDLKPTVLVYDIAEALSYVLRAHNVLHQRIKPENIFFDEKTGNYLLGDWKAPVKIDYKPKGEDSEYFTPTFSEQITPTVYAAPEMIQKYLGKDVVVNHAKADVFALGMVLLETISPDIFTKAKELNQTLDEQQYEQLLAEIELDLAKVSKGEFLSKLVGKMLQYDQSKRISVFEIGYMVLAEKRIKVADA